jgi:hypothetical protein
MPGKRVPEIEDVAYEWPEKPAKPAKKKARAEVNAAAERPLKATSSKKEKPETKPEDLEPGAVVLYWDGWRGVIRDAFAPLDEFFVSEEDSGTVVRDDSGDIVHFKASELELVAGPPIATPQTSDDSWGPPGGVVLIGTEAQMMKMLEHFGSPDLTERHQPQQLLAFPCTMCDPDNILSVASQGVDDDVRSLGGKLRPDIHVALRAFHLKQSFQEIGSDLLRMDGFYVMSAISMPYPWEDIESVKGWWKKWRREVCNQIDVGPIRGFSEPGDTTPEDTARRVLRLECGIDVSLVLWDPEVQNNLRQKLTVDLPLEFSDVNNGRISVIIIPSDAPVNTKDGILRFKEAANADYLATGVVENVDDQNAQEEDSRTLQSTADKKVETRSRQEATAQGKTIAEWEKEQDQFSHLPKLPEGWVRVKSQKTGQVYFFNKKTKQSTFEHPEPPLPEGWTKETSKSTGKTYYFHAKKKKSQFERPTN